MRWTARVKAQLIEDIREGLISREQAMRAHDLTSEELLDWMGKYARGGKEELKIKEISRMRATKHQPILLRDRRK